MPTPNLAFGTRTDLLGVIALLEELPGRPVARRLSPRGSAGLARRAAGARRPDRLARE